MSIQPFQTTQVVHPPATGVFPGRDLVSIRDLSPIEVEAIFHLAGLMKARPANFRSALAGKQMVMFFEKPSLRTRLTFEAGMCQPGRSRHVRGPDFGPARCARKAERHRAQPRALGGRHRAAHLRPQHG